MAQKDLTTSVCSNFTIYLDICNEAAQSETKFATFKRHPHYTPILEHVSELQGKEYIAQIAIQGDAKLLCEPWISRFRMNDQLGSPVTYDYAGTVGSISPTTLRYIKVLSDLTRLYGSLDHFHIAEIGCGYGGQAKIIHSFYPNIGSYTLIDLPAPCRLIDAYLKKSSPDLYKLAKIMPCNVPLPIRKVDLVISNYAFAECSAEVRKNYVSDVLNQSARGYLTMNWPMASGEKEQLLRDLSSIPRREVSVVPEMPLTGANNYIITWLTR